MVDRVEVPAEETLVTNDGYNPNADNAGNDLILGKFKSYDDLEKSYKELESRLGKQGQNDDLPPEKPEPSDDWQQEDAPEQGTTEQISEALPGFSQDSIEEMSQHAWENGSLTDDHYADLEKAGYSRDIVDAFIDGQFAAAQATQSQLVNAGGGADKVEAMFEWAQGNLEQSAIDAYNERFDRGGPDAIMAMEHLAAKYDASGEARGSRMSGANAPVNAGPEPYRSVAQVTADMQDPRYHTDPSFRDEVARRLARSNVL